MFTMWPLAILGLSELLQISGAADPKLPSNSAAADKASAFLWSQVHRETSKWPEGEVSSAILGLVAAKPPVEGGKFLDPKNQLIINLNIEQMAADFLSKLLKPDKKKQLGTLANIDIPTLISYIGVLQVNCKDPRNYFGFDLVQEAVHRLEEVTNTAPTYGALVMTICNADADHILKKPHFQSFVKAVPTTGSLCPFCVERSSMNILALACLVNKASNSSEDAETHLPSVRSLRGLIGRYTKYLDSVQEKDGGFGSLFATALAIQAKLSTKVKTEFDIDGAWKYLKSVQKPDGSFGHSITFTAIALPALTGQTLIDVKRIVCPDPEVAKQASPTLVVAYELEDLVFSQQKLRGHLVVKKATTLQDALVSYSNENPAIFKLETETVGLGTRIKSVNGIRNDEGATTHWFVDAIYKDGRVVAISSKLNSSAVEDSDKVVYRMSYKTAKLSL